MGWNLQRFCLYTYFSFFKLVETQGFRPVFLPELVPIFSFPWFPWERNAGAFCASELTHSVEDGVPTRSVVTRKTGYPWVEAKIAKGFLSKLGKTGGDPVRLQLFTRFSIPQFSKILPKVIEVSQINSVYLPENLKIPFSGAAADKKRY